MPPGKHKSKLKAANANDTTKYKPVAILLSRYLIPIPYLLEMYLTKMVKPMGPINNSIIYFPGTIFFISLIRGTSS